MSSWLLIDWREGRNHDFTNHAYTALKIVLYIVLYIRRSRNDLDMYSFRSISEAKIAVSYSTRQVGLRIVAPTPHDIHDL